MDFFGHPMIGYPLRSAQESGLFDKIHVSTDDPEICGVAERLGVKPDFMRPKELADDQTPLMPVLRYVLAEYERRGQAYATICLLMPCAPLIEAVDLKAAHAIFCQHDPRRPLLAVSTYPAPIEWAYERAADGRLAPVQPGLYAVRSQDLSHKYYDSGTFCFFDRSHILAETPACDKDFVSYVLPRSKAVDVDDADDLEMAKALFLARKAAASSKPPR